jgi:outer membrane receptor for ferrienterochelin and colicins
MTFSDVTYDKKTAAGPLERTRQLFAPRWSGNYIVSYTFRKSALSVDLTGNWYGPQRLPVFNNDYRPEYSPWFAIVNLNLRKSLRAFDLYGGIKNLGNFVPRYPIMRPFDPFNKTVNDPVNNPNGYTFDPSYNYASLQGITFYLGIRVSIR